MKIRAKLGFSVDGEEISVTCADDAQMNDLARQWVKGDVVEMPVDLRPPFGSPRGSAVAYFAPGAFKTASGPDWR